MPITELNALGFNQREDSEQFAEEIVDPSIRKEFEGGFVQSRARFTRLKKIYTTGWTDIPEAQKAIFTTFIANMRGGAASFTYIHPVSGEAKTVKFAAMPQIKYAGIGGFHRWNITGVKLEEV